MVTEYLLDVQPGLWKVIAADDGTDVNRYIHDPVTDRILQHEGPSSDWNWPTLDGLGTVRGVYDDTLAEVYAADRDPYGDLINSSGVNPTPFEYTGEMRDVNGLQYHRARYLDTALGVWISEDPVETRNRYAYVGGDPVNMVDLSGLLFENPGVYRSCGNKHFLAIGQNDGECQSNCEMCCAYKHIYDKGYNIFTAPTRAWIAMDDCIDFCHNPKACPEVAFMLRYRDEIDASSLTGPAAQAGVSPILLGMIVENEWHSTAREESYLPTWVIRDISPLLGSPSPSFGIGEIQQANAVRIIQSNPDVFADAVNLSPNQVGSRLHEDPSFNLLVGAYLIAELQESILSDLESEVGIQLGDGQCLSENSCTISQETLENLILVSWKQGWVNPSTNAGVLDLLHSNRQPTAAEYHAGILNTILVNSSHVDGIRSYEERIRQCVARG